MLRKANYPLSEKNLTDSLKSIFKFRSKKDLFIYADKSIPYGKIIAVMNAGKHAGVHRMAMLTKPLKVKNKLLSTLLSMNDFEKTEYSLL